MSSYPSSPPEGTHLWAHAAHLTAGLAGGGELVLVGWIAGRLGARVLRRRGLAWSWALLALAPAVMVWSAAGWRAIVLPAAAVSASRTGWRWHRYEVQTGGDLAQAARGRYGPLDGLRLLGSRWALRGRRWFTADGLLIGHDRRGAPVRIPVGDGASGSHTLVAGATGSGKTVTQTWIAVRCIERGWGVVVQDPKGDALMRRELERAARADGRRFIEWTPEGPAVYNPFAQGADTEIADKALAGELFTEPHYQRLAQRYLGHEVRVLRALGLEITLALLVAHLDPLRLEIAARRLPEADAEATFAYLDSLTARQTRDLSGARDRLAVLAESDAGRWLDPEAAGRPSFNLLDELRDRSVVYLRLDADRRPLLSQMLGAAVVQDLLTAVAAMQREPVPSLVVIDEFSAVAAGQVARLFGRARSAGMSLVLGTQELSDLRLPGRERLLEQVLGNVGAVVAHRQVVPASAELVAGVGGTRGAWSTAHRDGGGWTHTRVREHAVHPDQIKALPPGCAAVVVPGAAGEDAVRVTRLLFPR